MTEFVTKVQQPVGGAGPLLVYDEGRNVTGFVEPTPELVAMIEKSDTPLKVYLWSRFVDGELEFDLERGAVGGQDW